MKLVVAFVDWKGQSVDSCQRFCLAAKIIDTEAGGVDVYECQWKVEGADTNEFVGQIIASEDALSSTGYKTIAIAMCFRDAQKEDHG